MNKIIRITTWWIFGGLCILVGLYPIIYFVVDRHFGLLSSKTQELLHNQAWNVAFYIHIVLGGVALLIGWTQFISKLRKRRVRVHRTIGKIYVASALLSSVCGIYIAQFATGGTSNIIGFSLSGLVWLSTTFLAYYFIRQRQVARHQQFMIYSYAVCFSAVTLRIWLPVLLTLTGSFNTGYLIVGWVSWVPNLIVAAIIIHSQKIKPAASAAVANNSISG